MKTEKLVPIALIFDGNREFKIFAIHDPATCRKAESPPVLPDCPGCQAEQLAEWMKELFRPELVTSGQTLEGTKHGLN